MTDGDKLSQDGRRAIELFNEQLVELAALRNQRGITPDLSRWKDSTKTLFMKYLPASPHYTRFCNIQFGIARRRSFSGRGNPSPQALDIHYQQGCDAAEKCIKGTIQEIERFDVAASTQSPRPEPTAQLRIDAHAPITINSNLAIAMDNATQNVSQVATQGGATLAEITALLETSLELNKRQMLEALQAVNAIAVEMQKPKSGWNWRTILDSASKLSAIMTLATDISSKLSHHLPWIIGVMEQAKKALGH